jgi:anti-anti-sigma factor
MPKLVKYQGTLVVEMPHGSWDQCELLMRMDDLLADVARKTPHVVVDLTTTAHLPGSVLGVLVRNWRQLRSRGGRLVVVANNFQREVFELTHLDRIFTLTESRGEALAVLAASA